MKIKTLALLTLLLTGSYSYSTATEKDSEQQPQRVVIVKKTFTPHLRVNVYTLYAFDDKVDSYWSSTEFFHGTMEGGFQWGGGLEYMMAPDMGVEFSYLRLDSDAPMTYWDNGEKKTRFDYASNYIMLGGNRYLGMNPKVEPYIGGQIGLAVINAENPDNRNSDRVTKFAWGIKLGVNIWASDKVGLKLQTGLLSAVQAAGGGFYFGSGGGGAGVSLYSSVYQWNIGGGLTFSLGD